MLVGLRSRRHIAPFSLHRPETWDEAVALRRQPGSSAFLAGGIDLIDRLKHGHVIDRLIRLDGIPGLAEIRATADSLRIGALATHAAVADSTAIRGVLPDLAVLWQHVANPRVRFAGTIGGNVMARRPDYDGLPALLAAGAEAEIAADRIALSAVDDLVTGFVIARPKRLRLFADRSLRPAISIWLGVTVTDGQVGGIRAAIGMAHPSPVCVSLDLNMSLASLTRHAASIADTVAGTMPDPMTDPVATASYRRRMARVLTTRLLSQAGGAA
jgi:aerobic carbon-monoxide dehydrogenase medium subunit